MRDYKVISSLNGYKILTYNILAPFIINKYESKEFISWDYRWNLIKKELKIYNSDIICFQEIQCDIYVNDVLPFLQEKKFMSYYIPRNPNMPPSQRKRYPEFNNNMTEGIMIAYNMNIFRCLHINSIDMISLMHQYFCKNNISLTKEIKHKIYQKFVAMSLLMEEIKTENKFILSTVHAFHDPNYDDLKNIHMYLLFNEINKFSANNKLPSIICGDFNMKPNSAPYIGITTGKSSDNYEFKLNKELKPKHPIFYLPKNFTKYKYQSGFYKIFGKEPKYTNYTNHFKDTLDYIFVNDKINIIGTLEDINLDKYEKLPTPELPSDHIPMSVIFNLKN